MRRSMRVIIIFLLCCGPFLKGFAQNLKVGVVNTSYILENAPQSAEFREKLVLEFAKRERQLNENRTKLRVLQDQLDQVKNVAESDNLIKQINRLERDTARLADDFRQDYTLRINEELLKVQKEVANEIIQYAKENQFDLILESGVFYANPKLIVTDNILMRLNK